MSKEGPMSLFFYANPKIKRFLLKIICPCIWFLNNYSFIFSLFQIFPSSELSKSCRNLIDFNQIWIRNQSDFVSKSDPNLAQIMQIDVHISAHILGRSRWCFRFYAGRHVKEFSTRFEQDFEQKSDSFRFQIWSKSDKNINFSNRNLISSIPNFPKIKIWRGGRDFFKISHRFHSDFCSKYFRFLLQIWFKSVQHFFGIITSKHTELPRSCAENAHRISTEICNISFRFRSGFCSKSNRFLFQICSKSESKF